MEFSSIETCDEKIFTLSKKINKQVLYYMPQITNMLKEVRPATKDQREDFEGITQIVEILTKIKEDGLDSINIEIRNGCINVANIGTIDYLARSIYEDISYFETKIKEIYDKKCSDVQRKQVEALLKILENKRNSLVATIVIKKDICVILDDNVTMNPIEIGIPEKGKGSFKYYGDDVLKLQLPSGITVKPKGCANTFKLGSKTMSELQFDRKIYVNKVGYYLERKAKITLPRGTILSRKDMFDMTLDDDIVAYL